MWNSNARHDKFEILLGPVQKLRMLHFHLLVLRHNGRHFETIIPCEGHIHSKFIAKENEHLSTEDADYFPDLWYSH